MIRRLPGHQRLQATSAFRPPGRLETPYPGRAVSRTIRCPVVRAQTFSDRVKVDEVVSSMPQSTTAVQTAWRDRRWGGRRWRGRPVFRRGCSRPPAALAAPVSRHPRIRQINSSSRTIRTAPLCLPPARIRRPPRPREGCGMGAPPPPLCPPDPAVLTARPRHPRGVGAEAGRPRRSQRRDPPMTARVQGRPRPPPRRRRTQCGTSTAVCDTYKTSEPEAD